MGRSEKGHHMVCSLGKQPGFGAGCLPQLVLAERITTWGRMLSSPPRLLPRRIRALAKAKHACAWPAPAKKPCWSTHTITSFASNCPNRSCSSHQRLAHGARAHASPAVSYP